MLDSGWVHRGILTLSSCGGYMKPPATSGNVAGGFVLWQSSDMQSQ
ncbi:MAG: hypothetical protein K2H16_10720 [Prevotella sp.]|nr:hypothetical protein [Prevotella sp.]